MRWGLVCGPPPLTDKSARATAAGRNARRQSHLQPAEPKLPDRTQALATRQATADCSATLMSYHSSAARAGAPSSAPAISESMRTTAR
eukprot:6214317-Alexandrium_andersonii.AAC.1